MREREFAAGLNARIDATRSQVQLQTGQQRLRSLQADTPNYPTRMRVVSRCWLYDLSGFTDL